MDAALLAELREAAVQRGLSEREGLEEAVRPYPANRRALTEDEALEIGGEGVVEKEVGGLPGEDKLLAAGGHPTPRL